ncbi:hypothetical protein PS2_007138 [Malus domestica]
MLKFQGAFCIWGTRDWGLASYEISNQRWGVHDQSPYKELDFRESVATPNPIPYVRIKTVRRAWLVGASLRQRYDMSPMMPSLTQNSPDFVKGHINLSAVLPLPKIIF